MKHRALLVGLAALVVTSCASSGAAPRIVRSESGSSQPDSASTSLVPDDATTSTGATTTVPEGARVSGNGIAVVADESGVKDASAPFVLTDVQARRLAQGGVMIGSELDHLAPMPDGSPPMSYLLAAWVTTGTSDSAQQAKAQMGEHDWHHAPEIVFPAGVVATFVGDLAATADAEMPPVASEPTDSSPPASASGIRKVPARADGPCSAVNNFISDVLGKLFGALRITPSTTTDDSIFSYVTSGLTILWNAAVDLAQGFVQGLIDTITKPVFDAIRLGVSALGVATTIASYFQQEELVVDLDPQGGPEVYHFAVGDSPDVTGSFIAKGRELTDDWPPAITDCAKVAGAPLPKLLAPGSPVTWKVSQAGSTVIVPGDLKTVVKSDLTAELKFTTGRESEEDAKGDEVVEPAVASVAIERKEVRDFLQLASKTVETGLLQLLGSAPAKVRDIAAGIYHKVVDPNLEALQQAVNGDLGVFSLRGTATVNVLHHKPPDTTIPDTPPPTPPPSDDQGDFCAQYRDLMQWTSANAGSIDMASFGAEIVARMQKMRPSAPANLAGYADDLIRIYSEVAGGAGILVLEQEADSLQAASSALGNACT